MACYASLDAYADSALVRAAVRSAADAGFQAVKLHEKQLPEGRRTDAREQLRTAVQMLETTGMEAHADRAHRELRAAVATAIH